MKFDVEKFKTIVSVLAPVILANVPNGEKIAEFVPVIVHGISAAEAIKGASGAAKKAHVLNLAMTAAAALNATGKLKIDVVELGATVGAGIDAVIGAVKSVEKAHVTPGVLLPPSAPQPLHPAGSSSE